MVETRPLVFHADIRYRFQRPVSEVFAMRPLTLLCLFLAGCSGGGGDVTKEESRSEPRTDHERAVLAHLKAVHGQVEVLSWGPHMTRAEWEKIAEESGLRDLAKADAGTAREISEMGKVDATVRVCFKADRETYDRLYLVIGKFVKRNPFGDRPGDDDWVNGLKSAMMKHGERPRGFRPSVGNDEPTIPPKTGLRKK